MRLLIILLIFICSCRNNSGEGLNGLVVLDPAVAKIQLELKVASDSIRSLVSQLKVLKAADIKINATLNKKDTFWFEGFGGYGTKTAPYNLKPVKNDAVVLKRSILDVKAALVLIRSDISVSKARLGLLEKNVANLLAALAAIRQDIAELKAKK